MTRLTTLSERAESRLEEPHTKLHNSVIKINTLLAQDNAGNPLRAVADVYASETRPCLAKVQTLLKSASRQVRGATDETDPVTQTSQETAETYNLWVTILSIGASALALLIAWLVSRDVICILKRLISNLGEGSEQVYPNVA